ncbi:MAG: heme-binding protein, partial [Proteobacteria bacterium]|nr:heme-binding protein [Pseudomonadota bacterium]
MLLTVVACGGGSRPQSPDIDSNTLAQGCDGSCASTTTRLTVADVEGVIARAVNEAQARGANGTIAVVDRVGNVLAVFRMNAAPASIT